MGGKIQDLLRGVMLRALMVIDISLLMLSFAVAAVFVKNGERWADFAGFFATKVTLLSCVLFAIAMFMGHGILVMFNLYQSKRMSTKGAEAFDVLGAMALLTVCLWCEAKLFRVSGNTTFFLLAFCATGTGLIMVVRLLLRSVLGNIRKHGKNLHQVLILGTNTRAINFARKIETMPERGFGSHVILKAYQSSCARMSWTRSRSICRCAPSTNAPRRLLNWQSSTGC